MDNESELIATVEACPICHGRAFRSLSLPGRWIGPEVFEPHRDRLGLARCLGCGLELVNPRPSPRLLAAFYGGKSYECHRAERGGDPAADKADFVLERIRRHAPDARRLLDYGCGGGFLCRRARQQGFSPIGYDIGAEALRACRAQDLEVTDSLAAIGRGEIDAIVLHHVFEHVPDPRRVLMELAPLLAHDGRLFIEVPNVASLRARLSGGLLRERLDLDERHRAYPIHLWYFAPATLRRLLVNCGFEVSTVETYGVGLDELVWRKPRSVASGSTRARRPPRPLRSLVKRALFSVDLGENLLAVASAPAAARSAGAEASEVASTG
jgi:SAM-dependent methyltransferase